LDETHVPKGWEQGDAHGVVWVVNHCQKVVQGYQEEQLVDDFVWSDSLPRAEELGVCTAWGVLVEKARKEGGVVKRRVVGRGEWGEVRVGGRSSPAAKTPV